MNDAGTWSSSTAGQGVPGMSRAPRPRVGFQGEPGAYSEAALAAYFGTQAVEPVPCPTFADVFEALMGGILDRAMVPVENSYAGDVGEVYDLFRRHPVRIRGELQLPVRHCLLALPQARLDDLRIVRSHPQALAQCREFLRRHRLTAEPVYDTAAAARQVAEAGRRDLGAIAARQAAERYGLAILAADIQDAADNVTRFYHIEREEPGDPQPAELPPHPDAAVIPRPAPEAVSPMPPTVPAARGPGTSEPSPNAISAATACTPAPAAAGGENRRPEAGPPAAEAVAAPGAAGAAAITWAGWKTSLLFVGADRPGALYRCLGAFARRDINLTKLTARPVQGGSWQYMFFADLEGTVDEPRVAQALAELKQQATFVRVLGSFPVYRVEAARPAEPGSKP